MALKGRPSVLRELAASVDVRRPHVQFDRLGAFDGSDGRPIRITRRLRWTDQDVLYFTGYTLWNYITAPFMLANDDVTVEELAGSRLRATFPPELPTHSRKQTFHLGQDGRITRVDYTAEVFGPWARAANHCLVHERVDGLPFATRTARRSARSPRPTPRHDLHRRHHARLNNDPGSYSRCSNCSTELARQSAAIACQEHSRPGLAERCHPWRIRARC